MKNDKNQSDTLVGYVVMKKCKMAIDSYFTLNQIDLLDLLNMI